MVAQASASDTERGRMQGFNRLRGDKTYRSGLGAYRPDNG